MSALRDAAAAWFARINGDPTTDERARFDAWLAADPAHVDAYASVAETWDRAGGVGADPRVAARARALRAAAQRPRTPWRAMAAAAALVLAAGAGVTALVVAQPGAPALPDNVFATGVGERSVVALDDGSKVTLNADSRVRVDYTEETRGLTLVQGQALFEVAKNPDRPFIVTAGARRITALGTQFDVRMDESLLQVTLLEGRVSVDDDRAEHAELAPGEQLIAKADATAEIARTDVAKVTSWRDGRFVFEDEPLAQAVASVNRYLERDVILGDDERLGELKVTGVFSTDRPGAFVTALEAFFPVEVRQDLDPDVVVLMWRE